MTTVTPGAEPVAWMYQAHTPDGVKTVLTRLKSTHYDGYPVTDETPLYATPPDALPLEKLNKAATPGTWEVDSEYDNDALYSGGGGCGSGFKNYFIGAEVDGEWKTLMDTVNSDHKLIEEEYDEDGKASGDSIGLANAEFVAALVNAYRSRQLVPALSLAGGEHQPKGDLL